jgi:hypothetical protein
VFAWKMGREGIDKVYDLRRKLRRNPRRKGGLGHL